MILFVMKTRHVVLSYPGKASLYSLKPDKLGSVANLGLPNTLHFHVKVIISMQKS